MEQKTLIQAKKRASALKFAQKIASAPQLTEMIFFFFAENDTFKVKIRISGKTRAEKSLLIFLAENDAFKINTILGFSGQIRAEKSLLRSIFWKYEKKNFDSENVFFFGK